ncbi:hypothetical protein DEU42_106150 [Flavobacterium sp. AG291]|nr:hypothetical protein DEU42_106150 [Flavobacterium sp. AG291]
MFKSVLLAAPFFTVPSILAQTTGTTNLNVNLASVLAIEVSDPTVVIQMNTPAHFSSGSTTGTLSDHLKVTANEGFTVTVEAAGNLSNAGEEIPVSTVVVSSSSGSYLGASGSTAPTTNPTFPSSALALSSSAPVTIISCATGDLRGYDVAYSIPAANTPSYLDKTPGVYTTLLTYTIVAD